MAYIVVQNHPLWQQTIQSLEHLLNQNLVPYLSHIAAALAIFFIGKWLVSKTIRWAERSMEKRMDHIVARFLANILHVALFFIVLVAAISQLGFETTSLVAILGAISFAVALSLKDSLSNFASGVLLVVLRPFRVGDYIETSSIQGTVKDIKIFATTLTTADNRVILVPNSRITGDHIINHYVMPTRRIDMIIKVPHQADLGRIKADLLQLMERDQRVLEEPAPMVAVAAIADAGVNLNVRPWVESGNYWSVCWSLTEKIKTHFSDIGLSLPAQQVDIVMANAAVDKTV